MLAKTRNLGFSLKRFARERRGAVAATVGLLAIPLTLAMGLAVDGSRLYLVRSKLAQAVDAAALAAAQVPDEVTQRADAERLFFANFPEGYLSSEQPTLTINFDDASGRVVITAAAEVPTAVMQLISQDYVRVTARAVAQRQVKAMELAMVLDITGSMAGSRIIALKQAVRDLLDILYGPNDTAEELTVSMVPFNARVNVGTNRKSWLSTTPPSNWLGCFNARSGALALNDAPPADGKWPHTPRSVSYVKNGKTQSKNVPCPAQRILPLTESKSTIVNAVNALQVGGTTRIDMGARWGWRTLSEQWQGVWGTAGSPRDADRDLTKAVIVMTDGDNVVDAHYDEVSSVAQADANLLAICQGMKDEGITVFTIGFMTSTEAGDLLRSCATEPSYFYESPSNEELRQAFRQIAGRLSALRLVE
jgi:Flp pilus assembly protein TadG